MATNQQETDMSILNNQTDKHYYLVYLSNCANDMSETDVLQILIRSFDNNEKNNITSMLVHRTGQFLQMIEGDEFAVIKLYKKIKADNRHWDVSKVDFGFKADRYCSEFIGFRHKYSDYAANFAAWFDEGFHPYTLAKYKALTLSFLRSIAASQPKDEQAREYAHYKVLCPVSE